MLFTWKMLQSFNNSWKILRVKKWNSKNSLSKHCKRSIYGAKTQTEETKNDNKGLLFITIHFCLNTQSVEVCQNITFQKWDNIWKLPKNTIKSENFPKPAFISGKRTYQNLWVNQTHNIRKFGGDTILQTLIIVNSVWKYPKTQQNQGTLRYIACSNIWHVNTSHKCRSFFVFFADIGFPICPNKVSKIKTRLT